MTNQLENPIYELGITSVWETVVRSARRKAVLVDIFLASLEEGQSEVLLHPNARENLWFSSNALF